MADMPPANISQVEQAKRAEDAMFKNELFERTKLNEGYRESVYKDSKGNPTIGIGFNLNDADNLRYLKERGVNAEALISGKEALTPSGVKQLYVFSMNKAYNDALKFDPDLASRPRAAQAAILDMSFNLGLTKLNKFVEMKKALQANDYQKAADEMVDSNWYKQVKTRGPRMVDIMRSASK